MYSVELISLRLDLQEMVIPKSKQIIIFLVYYPRKKVCVDSATHMSKIPSFMAVHGIEF